MVLKWHWTCLICMSVYTNLFDEDILIDQLSKYQKKACLKTVNTNPMAFYYI